MAKTLFRPAAEAELKEAYSWYEEREAGLGTEFLRCVENGIQLIQRHPEIYPVVHKGIRQAVIRRFPYSVFYLTSNETIVVLAIFHASRNPVVWKQRARFQ